jgi:hypothetical protein
MRTYLYKYECQKLFEVFPPKTITFIYFSLVLHSFTYFFLLRLFTAALFTDSI